MKREFLIEEIIFSGVSGEVRGTIEIDVQSGSINHVDYESFCFRRDDLDSPTFLDEVQLATARAVVGQVLEGECDICDDSSRLVASAESHGPPSLIAPGMQIGQATEILAEYLQDAGGAKRRVEQVRRAQ